LRERVRIGDLWLDRVTTAETLAAIAATVGSRGRMRICTPNAAHVVTAKHDPAFRYAVNSADLAIADGMGVVYASLLLGRRLSLVSGRLILEPVCRIAADRGWTVAFYGGGPGVAAGAAECISRRIPKLHVVSAEAGFVSARGEGGAPAPPADILFVGLGTPKQELWLHQHFAELSCRVAIGVGAAFDFASGRFDEPPSWVTRSGLEWAIRLLREPTRLWRRYLVGIPEFALIVGTQRVRRTWTTE